MIKIEVTGFGKGAMEVSAQVDIKGRRNAVEQMFAVLTALDKMDDEVLCVAFEMFLDYKMKEKKEKKDDDKSEG